MRDIGASSGERSGMADSDLMEELESSRRRVGDLKRNLVERELQEAANQQEVTRLAEAFKPAKIRAWCWTAEARQTKYLPIRGDVRDSQGRHAGRVSLSEEKLLQFIHPDDRERLASTWDRAYEEHIAYEIEYRLVTASGEVRHNHEIARPEFDEFGRYMGHFGTTQDITDRVQAEDALREARDELEIRVKERTRDIEAKNEALVHEINERKRIENTLKESEERFGAFIENSPSAILIKDTEGRYLVANRCWHDWFNPQGREILGKTVFDFYPEKHAREITESDRHVVETGKMVEAEMGTPFADGTSRTTLLQKFPILGSEREITAIGGINTDITERRRVEEALRASEQALQEHIADLEAAQRKLEQQGESLTRLADDLLIARDEARAADRAKSEFLSAMSHELRTPMNAVLGFSEIMKNETLGRIGNSKYREYADDIHESGQHLLGLINDILDLSKIESGTEKLHEDKIVIPEFILSVLKLVGQRADQGAIKIQLELSDHLPALRADGRKLKQILVNLLSNAIKFSDAGGEVALWVWCRPDSGHVFQIIDTGIGIAPEDIPKALSRFGQVDGDLNRQYQGTGLGLPLTKALIELHGGTLDLQSRIDVGTIITVRFPAKRIVDSLHENEAID